MYAQRISVILMIVKLAVGLNSDGFCSFVETYTDRVTSIKPVAVKVLLTKRCGIFRTRTCYEYGDQTRWERVAENVQKTRTLQRCCEGYASKNSRCVPVCSVPCLNGVCTEPDTCTCSTGYHKNDKGVCIKNECEPTDQESDQCANGKCTSDGICVCNEGFDKSDSDVEPSVKPKCEPKCSDGCLNGHCVAPETCVCYSGHQSVNSSVCDPICQNLCVFGTCTKPDECTCFEGYQLRNGSTHICDPVCSGGCFNGKCESPDICICDEGYEFLVGSDVCEPVCINGCVNSNCTSPNVCTCHDGYKQSNSTHCDSVCENCSHGYCDEPNVCLCDIGYHMNDEETFCVQDECSGNMEEDSCENGYCLEGICVCDSGYQKNETKTCSPICSLPCVNGYCSEPEVCQCHSGYDFTTGNTTDDGNCTNCTNFIQWNVCNAVCEDCQNGTCNEGICYCIDEYSLHPNNRGKCILTAELVSMQSHNHATTITLSVLSAVLIVCLLGGFAYWKYVLWSRKSYECTSGGGVVYRKEKNIIEL
ncbi:tenascin-like isoform X2 [Bradysia coprophila]|uniref:tenascin-like isoform X2 n=1 Tax=Bradysia coprophila TaxID=38358 RepID=UPI00187D785E|nr:tenascin-like isoform X2 [Bradysia coprophila]